MAPSASTPRLARLGRSGLVGLAATTADLLSLVLLVDGLGLGATEANVPALALGLAIQFFGNKYFAFEDRSRAFARQGALFALVEAGAFAWNALGFHALVTFAGAPYLLARAVGSGAVYLGWSYPLWGLVFRPSPAPSRGALGPSRE